MLVLAPSGTGKSLLSSSFFSVVDGDIIIAERVGWPPGQWWLNMSRDEVADFKLRCTRALEPAVQTRSMVVVVAFYSLWRDVDPAHLAVVTPDATQLYLNSIQRRALWPRSVQPRYSSVDEAQASIDSLDRRVMPRDSTKFATVATAAGSLAKSALGYQVVGTWLSPAGTPGSRVVLAVKGTPSGLVVLTSSSGSKPVILAEGDDSQPLLDELALLGPSSRRATGAPADAQEELARCWLQLLDRFGA